MAVSFTVTPEPDHVPPRMRLDFDTGSGTDVFQDLQVTRDGVMTRSQPPVGSRTSLMYDYDADFGMPVTYTATGSASSFSTVLDETWADLTGWTTYSGTPAVAGSELTTGAVMQEVASAGGGAVTIHDAASFTGVIEFHTGAIAAPGGPRAETRLTLYRYGSNIAVSYGGGPTRTFAPGTGDFVLVGNTVTTSDGTFVMDRQLPAFDWIYATSTATAFKIEEPAGSPFTATATGQLDATQAWLYHPVNPDLSVCVSQLVGGRNDLNHIYVENSAGATVTYPVQKQMFYPLGRPRGVPVNYGPRSPGLWSLVLRTPSQADRQALRGLLADDSPILFRFPPSFPWDLDQGWFAVDENSDERVSDTPRIRRTMTLPLIPVDQPVLVQGTQWTWADVMANYATWADVMAAYDNWLGVLAGPAT